MEKIYRVQMNSKGMPNFSTAVEVEDRPQGEWVFVARGWYTLRRCSNCMWEQTYSDSKYMGYEYDYCPNCGARMKGADDE